MATQLQAQIEEILRDHPIKVRGELPERLSTALRGQNHFICVSPVWISVSTRTEQGRSAVPVLLGS
jgi:hypothetical protein